MENIQIEKKISIAIEKLLLETESYKSSNTNITQIEKGLLASLLRLGLVLLYQRNHRIY